MTSLAVEPPVVGTRLPRVASVPPHADDARGHEAVEFARRFGLVLDDWQADVLRQACSTRPDGTWSAFEVGVVVARQNGKGSILEARELAGLFLFGERLILHSAHEFKALRVDTPVLTTAGWSTMGDLVEGDEVFAPDGQPTKVIGAHPWRHDRPCYRLTFDDGQVVEADAEHLWSVYDSRDRVRRVLTTQEMVDGVVLTVTPRTGRDRRTYRYRVDVPAPLQMPDADLPVDPWVLGAWLGDGDSAGGRFTVGAADLDYLTDRLDRAGEVFAVSKDKRTDGRVFSVSVAGLSRRLAALEVRGDKRIPEAYLLGSEQQRRDLLAGIMDTDGTVSGHRAMVTMVKRALMEDVATLARSLGYKVTLRTFRASLNGHDAGPMYRVAMTAAQAVSPFQMPRKVARCRPRSASTTRAHYNAVTAIDPVEPVPTRCITVAHESSCYLVGRGFVPTHNTAAEAFRRVLFWVDNHDELRSLVSRVRTSHGEEGIELRNGNRLRFVARSTGSGRGFTGDTIIMDEAYALGAEAMGALLPTLSARPNPQLWYTSSAGMLKSSQLRAVRDRGREGTDPHLAYFEWSADADADPDDPAAWAAANPALGGRISVDFVARERQALPDGEFARERLGWWDDPEVVGTDIALEPWQALADPTAEPRDPVVFAFDVSPGFASASVVACGSGEDGRPVVEVVEHAPGTSWLVARLAGLQQAHGAGSVAFDPSGPAGSLQPELAAAGVAVDVVSSQRMTQACGAFIAAVADGQLAHRGERALTDAALAGRRRQSGDAARWSRRDSTVDISPLVAATIARHAWAERGDPEPGVWML